MNIDYLDIKNSWTINKVNENILKKVLKECKDFKDTTGCESGKRGFHLLLKLNGIYDWYYDEYLRQAKLERIIK